MSQAQNFLFRVWGNRLQPRALHLKDTEKSGVEDWGGGGGGKEGEGGTPFGGPYLRSFWGGLKGYPLFWEIA